MADALTRGAAPGSEQGSDGSERALERLDARAEAVARALDTGSEYTQGSSEPSSEPGSTSSSSVAAAAAVGPRPRPRAAAAARPRDLEEDDAVLKTASWRDMEDSRKFLENDHRERLGLLISRWEGAEDGDDVDLRTGRVVRSAGHLDALAPQRNMAFFEETSDEDEDEEQESDAGEDAGAHAGALDGGIDPLYVVCQKPAPLLDFVVAALRR